MACKCKEQAKCECQSDGVMPLAETWPEWRAPEDIGVRPDIQHKEGADPETGLTEGYTVPDAPYDVDAAGILLCWLDNTYCLYVVDGHHRLAHAKASQQFVSSRVAEGELTPVQRLIPIRVLQERDGWSIEAVQSLGRVANGDGHVADDSFWSDHLVEFLAADAVQLEEGESEAGDEIGGDSCAVIEILADDAASGVLRVRQRATRADSLNKNRRIYPRDVVQAMVDEARPRIKAGVMLSEMEHPERAKVCDSSGCGEKYVDNPERKTARVDAISDVGEDGWVTIDRTILPTEHGKLVADRIRAGGKAGISSRFAIAGDAKQVGGQSVIVARRMRLFTFDDVEHPAVDGAGEYQLLSDSELEQLGQDADPVIPATRTPSGGLGDPFMGVANNTANPVIEERQEPLDEIEEAEAMRRNAQDTEDGQIMDNKTEIRRLLRDFKAKVKSGASSADVNAADQAVADAILTAYRAGHDVAEFVPLYKNLATDAESIAGYHSGKDAPVVALGNELGDDPASGWGPDVKAGSGQAKLVAQNTSTTLSAPAASISAGDAADADFIKKLREEAAAKEAMQARTDSIEAKLTEVVTDSHPIKALPADIQEDILKNVRARANSGDDVMGLLDDQVELASRIAAQAKLAARGLHGNARGNTVIDPASPLTNGRVITEGIPVMDSVNKMLAAADDFRRESAGYKDHSNFVDPLGPGGKDELRRREINMHIARPVIEDVYGQIVARNGGNLGQDSVGSDSALAEAKTLQSMIAAGDSYTTVVSSMNNQPTLSLYLLVQAFQDMKMLEFCHAMGPGQVAGQGAPGWETSQGIGRVLRWPSETYVDPSGYGASAPPWDFGLLVAENGEIPEGTTNIYWDTIAPSWRKIAFSADIESIKAMGNGPLNYPVVARNLFHMSARKSRTIDVALANEIVDAALEYGATAVSAEAYTSGSSGPLDLDNNSVAVASGALTVNLNPTELASGAVSATDKRVTYGTGNATGGAAVLAALRLKTGCTGTSPSGTTIYTSSNDYGPTPIVRPRSLLTLTGPGADSASTLNAISVTLPASQVRGELGSDGNIYSYPGTTATYAIDYANGVLVFITGQVTRSGSVFTTATTVSYSYATNWDYFVADPAMVTLATGETIQQYYNKLLAKFDEVAAYMGTATRYVAPDLALSNLTLSAKITQAAIFYKLNSPDGTQLFPNETYYAQRNGIGMARTNTPWWLGSNGMVLTRRGTTKYAIDTPFEMRGPFAKYGTNGLLNAGEAYYAVENSAIFTPQTKDIDGDIVNPTSRVLLTY